MDSGVDAQSSSTQHEPTTLSFEKRSANDTRRENERVRPLSNSRFTVTSVFPLPNLRIAAQVDLVSAVGSGAKILLHIAKESADVFTPLKSVLGGICAICDQYEVCLLTSVSRAIYS